MKNLSENMDVELLISPAGKAMVLHRGDFEHHYSWAQYEPLNRCVELVSDEGDVDSLGFEVSAPMKAVLDKVRELFLVQMDEQNGIVKARLVKFTALRE